MDEGGIQNEEKQISRVFSNNSEATVSLRMVDGMVRSKEVKSICKIVYNLFLVVVKINEEITETV
jgi:hypothetical protein